MTNLIKIILPLFLLALIACGNPESSNSTAAVETPSAVPVAKKSMTETPKEITKEAETSAAKEVANADEVAMSEVKKQAETKQDPTTKQSSNKATSKPKAKSIADVKSANQEKKKNETAPPAPKPVVSAEIPTQTKEEPKVQVPAKKEEKVEVKKVDHQAWDALLRANVSSSGQVNYAAFKSKEAALDAYLESLKNNAPESTWSRNEKLAYWINAYNAFTVKLIVDNYPISSITKLHNGKPWDVKWIEIDGKSYSLNNIENDIIRPRFKEPRIHFAVNCAAQSCPPLLNRAWTAGNLNSNFEKQSKAFVNNSKYNKITKSSIEISKIFEWYGEDFGSIIDFLNKYSDTKIESDAKVTYKEYDWALNK